MATPPMEGQGVDGNVRYHLSAGNWYHCGEKSSVIREMEAYNESGTGSSRSKKASAKEAKSGKNYPRLLVLKPFG